MTSIVSVVDGQPTTYRELFAYIALLRGRRSSNWRRRIQLSIIPRRKFQGAGNLGVAAILLLLQVRPDMSSRPIRRRLARARVFFHDYWPRRYIARRPCWRPDRYQSPSSSPSCAVHALHCHKLSRVLFLLSGSGWGRSELEARVGLESTLHPVSYEKRFH